MRNIYLSIRHLRRYCVCKFYSKKFSNGKTLKKSCYSIDALLSMRLKLAYISPLHETPLEGLYPSHT